MPKVVDCTRSLFELLERTDPITKITVKSAQSYGDIVIHKSLTWAIAYSVRDHLQMDVPRDITRRYAVRCD